MLEAASILCSLTERKRMEHQKQVTQGNGSMFVPRGAVGQMQPLKQQAQSYLLPPAKLRQNYPATTVVNNGIYSQPNNYDYRGPYAESVMVHEPQNYLGTTTPAESGGSITSGTPRKTSLSPEYASSNSKQDEQSASSLSEGPNSKANGPQWQTLVFSLNVTSWVELTVQFCGFNNYALLTDGRLFRCE